jgi:hypothetical protein
MGHGVLGIGNWVSTSASANDARGNKDGWRGFLSGSLPETVLQMSTTDDSLGSVQRMCRMRSWVCDEGEMVPGGATMQRHELPRSLIGVMAGALDLITHLRARRRAEDPCI